MAATPLVLLSRRPALYKLVADWDLPDVDVFVHDAPAEALAQLAGGGATLFLFDTVDFARTRHVVRKFVSLKSDADLVILGEEEALADLAEEVRGVASNFLPADAPEDEIRVVVERLLQLRKVRRESGITGRSPAVGEMISLIAQVAPLDVNVLVLGESGTGKELVARAIHAHSPRRTGPFISLNCGAISEGVLESELFGHARGAFTGAVATHEGVFKRADGGTLFLDEVAEMPLGMQTRFLRALETGEFTPVGGRQLEHSDIRLVAATHRDLARAVEDGRFRQDLYYRLRVVVIRTPPLRERKGDIPVLAESFVKQENARHHLAVRGLSRPALERLQQHSWPGNVRELRNVISAAVVIKQRGYIERDDLPLDGVPGERAAWESPYLPVPVDMEAGGLDLAVLASTLLELRRDVKEIKALLREGAMGGRIPPSSLVKAFTEDAYFTPVAQPGEGGELQTAERAIIEAALRASGGHRRKAAERLGISERTLYRKIRQYGL
ncbi:MAG: sigma-54 dependent transcriptional regulator [Candidatus Krumholzibacteriia bacterium]